LYAPQQPQPFVPQPNVTGPAFGYIDRQPFEGERPQQGERNTFQPRGDRPQPNRHDNRPPRPPFTDRGDNAPRDNRGGPDGRQPREFRNYRDNPAREPQPSVDVAPVGLPSFITAAPRLPSPADSLDAPQPVVGDAPEPIADVQDAAPSTTDEAPADGRFPRGRRRRLRSPYGFHAGGEDAPVAPVSPNGGPSSE
jgi:hypothetical protein